MDVILVDEKDQPIGTMGKLEVHQKALLHRAFSVFIFNEKGEMLLHKRADKKYHSGGLWTNACCSHPRPGEETLTAAQLRLQEEMGFKTELKKAFDFIYKAPFDNGLTEHELDHVMIGYYDENPKINKEEVEDFKWMKLEDVLTDMNEHPNQYTEWFKIIFKEFYDHIEI